MSSRLALLMMRSVKSFDARNQATLSLTGASVEAALVEAALVEVASVAVFSLSLTLRRNLFRDYGKTAEGRFWRPRGPFC